MRPVVVCALLGLAGPGCNQLIDYGELIPTAGDPADICCAPQVVSDFDPGVAVDSERYGTAQVFVSAGIETELYRDSFVIVGAPGTGTPEELTRIHVYDVDHSDGSLTTNANSPLSSPDPARDGMFGANIIVSDVLECHEPTPGTWLGCGQEFLVSSSPPSPSTQEGRVFVYAYEVTANTGQWTNSHTISRPLHSPGDFLGPHAGDEFGKHLAAPRPMTDPDEPWHPLQEYPTFIAIGSGDYPEITGFSESVFVVAVDPTDHVDPFRRTDILPWVINSAFQFGDVETGDWNHDGIQDLAMSILMTANYDYGTVHVELGLNGPGDPDWLDGTQGILRYTELHSIRDIRDPGTTNPTTGDPNRAAKDKFGAVLETGWFHVDEGLPDDPSDDELREALLIGDPGYGGSVHKDGQLCEIRWEDGETLANKRLQELVPNNYCLLGSLDPSGTDTELGRGLAIGNFIAADSRGVSETVASMREEVAVGYQDNGTASIRVYGTDGFGTGTIDEDAVYTTLTQTRTPPSATYGQHMSIAHTQRLMAGGFVTDRWDDLIIGVPGSDRDSIPNAGHVEITEALKLSGCLEPFGYWRIDPGGPPDVVMCSGPANASDTVMRIVILRDIPATIRDSSGVLCSAISEPDTADTSDTGDDAALDGVIPAGTHFAIANGPWTCGITAPSSHIWDVPADDLIALLVEQEGQSGTIEGETLRVGVEFFPNSSAPDDDQVQLVFDLTPFDNEKFGMDDTCQFEPLPLMERIDGPCED